MIEKITNFGVNNIYTSNFNSAKNNVNFTSRQTPQILKDMLNKSFERLYKTRFNNHLGQFAGTTKDGVKVFIDETRFGKEANLYIQKSNAQAAVSQYTLLRDTNKVLNDENKEVSKKHLYELNKYITSLK